MPATTKSASSRYDMLTNVPVVMDIKYCDVWPDSGKGFGSQVSLKGVVNGETVTIYLKGKTWANLKALLTAGVIANYDKEQEEPTEKVNIPVVDGNAVTLCRRQLAGEKYASLVVETGRVATPATPASAKPSTVKQGFDIGGPIPGLDEDDLPPPIEEAYDRVGSVQPHPSGESPASAKLAALFALQGACFKNALLLAAEAEAAGIPVTLEGVSALTAQMVIAANQRGIAA